MEMSYLESTVNRARRPNEGMLRKHAIQLLKAQIDIAKNEIQRYQKWVKELEALK
jgi:hypothetical protein